MCYLIAKRFNGHGIQIVTINKTEGYPEYKPYDMDTWNGGKVIIKKGK